MAKKNKLKRQQSDRDLVFDRQFREDLKFWISTTPKIALRVLDLVEDIERDPFKGLGKPEPLKYVGSDVWSRRLTQEHRLIYRVLQNRIVLLAAKHHY